MKIEQQLFKNGQWTYISKNDNKLEPSIVFIFGSKHCLLSSSELKHIKFNYPKAILCGCTTAGEIGKTFVSDETIVVTAIEFEKTAIKFTSESIHNVKESFEVGTKIVKNLISDDLQHILIFSEGLNINGTRLVDGCQSALPANVNISGGLSADAAHFEETFVILNDGTLMKNMVTAIGFYGASLKIGNGSIGGWDIFGIERMVTKSVDNVLFEIDNAPALALYKTFLGDKSADLPASALLFPLSIRTHNNENPIVRTILSINEEDQSMTFAGDIPLGSFVRLMKADMNRLIEGAEKAATESLKSLNGENPQFALLVSCVGRKLVLKQIVEEEVEGVQNILSQKAMITGFYSYGEISPFSTNKKCTLHNQTMTITTFSE